jgi:hypothetical protein
MFTPGYWEKWEQDHGHNFYDVHFARTVEYDAEFIRDLSEKTVLEVGGYPGLETAALLNRGALVTVLDSPEYTPDHYKKFLEKHKVEQIVWDIVQGKPRIDRKWDVALMSDVLMHIDGFPYEFMDWLFDSVGVLILSNYPSTEKTTINARAHTLFQGYGTLGGDAIIELAAKRGFHLKKRMHIAGRDVIIMEKTV